MTPHETFMQRCLELAKNGLGTSYPNPMVGAVIVHDGKIIGEGWHRKAGEPHAEVHAINSVKDPSLLRTSAIYVSLEPCSHFGKTPPCCDLIIAKDIPEVIVGVGDSFAKVDGEGIRKLRASGKKVTVGLLERECTILNKRFFTFHNKKRPYIILKWAQTANGFMAPTHKTAAKPVWITNEISRQLVHKWRTEEQGILIGSQTAIDDNPALTARDWAGKNPTRIVLDPKARIPKENHIFDNQATTLIISGKEVDFGQNPAQQIAGYLYQNGIQSVLVEGGRQTLQTFIDAGLWDEARIFTGATIFATGLKAPELTGRILDTQELSGDRLIMIANDDQHHYF